MGAGSTVTNCNYSMYTSSISHTPPSSTTFKALCKGRNNERFNLIQCKQYNTQLKPISAYDMFHCERTTMIHELRDSSHKRKRNRNFRSHFNMKPLTDLTNEDNPLQSSGKELLNTNDHTTGGLGGGCFVHNSDVGKEINIVNGDEFSICSERTPLHKDTCDTRFIIRHNIIQSSPNLKSVYDLFLSTQVIPKKKQMSCQLKKRPMVLNIHKYCSAFLNSNKDNSNKINDALALNISIDHVPQYQHNNNNSVDNSNNSNNIIVHQHNNNTHHHQQHHQLQSHTTGMHTQTQTQFSSNYNSSISNAMLFNYNNNTINSSINNISNITLSSNLKSIQHELSAQIATVYRLAKTRDSISSLDELTLTDIYQSKLFSAFKELSQASTHIIYSSYLNKMLNQMSSKFPSSSSQVKYSPKYCIVTKHEFAYYTSKEKLIMLGKPIISIPLKHLTKVSTITTNNKIHLLLFFKSNNNATLKKSSFENNYKKGESYFLFSGSERGLNISSTIDTKSTLMDKEICKWFLILNYLLLLTTK